MRRRSGFTLIEVLVSIVLTAVVSLLVYGAVQAARETQSRIADEHQSLQRALSMRLLLETAFIEAQTDFLAPDTIFVLNHRMSAQGIPHDQVTFSTSGDFPPLSPGADWLVTVASTREGLRLMGAPKGIRTPSRTLGLLPGVTGLRVRVRHPDLGASWSEEWDAPAVLPEEVELTYWTNSGPVGEPLRVSPALGRVR